MPRGLSPRVIGRIVTLRACYAFAARCYVFIVPGIGAGQLYHFQADGPWEPQFGNRFNSQVRLIDPYAKALAGNFLPATDGIVRPPKCVVIDETFDWQGDRHLRRNLSESVIYE